MSTKWEEKTVSSLSKVIKKQKCYKSNEAAYGFPEVKHLNTQHDSRPFWKSQDQHQTHKRIKRNYPELQYNLWKKNTKKISKRHYPTFGVGMENASGNTPDQSCSRDLQAMRIGETMPPKQQITALVLYTY